MKNKWVPLWIVPVVILFAIGTVWVRLAIVDTTYAIGNLDRQISLARQENESLQVKIAALRSPRRLEDLARSRFGLTQPEMGQTIHLKPEFPKRQKVNPP